MDINNRFLNLQQMKFSFFKSQNPENGRFDVAFEIEGKLLYAHKNMLNLVSDTFNSMLSDRWNPNNDAPIKIKDYSYVEFFQFLIFLYSGQCELNDSNIFAMVDMAEFHGVALFKEFCDEYLSKMEITNQNIFALLELADKYSMVQLKASSHAFICKNFQSFVECDGFLKADKQVIQEIIVGVKDKILYEDLFLAIYKWTEKHAMDKLAANPNMKLNETIKAEFSDFLPHILFREMELHFLLKFVVPKSFIFPSLDEFSEILCYCHLQTKVKVINTRGQELNGNILPDETMIDVIKSLHSTFCALGACDKYCWWSTDHKLSSTPKSIKKKDGIEWYLVCSRSGQIGVQHCSKLGQNNYLLAEMTSGFFGFQLTRDCRIQIE